MKKMTKKARALLVMVLSVTMLVGATMTTNAASANVTFTIEESDITTAVTVPSTIPIVFNADGTNTYPTNWAITNSGQYAGIYLKSVDGYSSTGWKFLDILEDTEDVPHDTKKVKFYMGAPGKLKLMNPKSSGEGSITWDEGERVSIQAGESKIFQFEVERGAFVRAQEEAVAFELTLNFEYN